MSIPETVSDTLWKYSLVVQTHIRWLVSDDPAGEEARCRGPGLPWLHVVCGCDSLKRRWRRLMVEKLTYNYLPTALVDIPAACQLHAPSKICGIVLCDRNAHFRVAFCCAPHKVHLCNDHADSSDSYYMTQLLGGWIVLEKEKCSIKGM